MGIQHVTANQLTKIHHSQQSLKQGQIIQGKILKLYPNNKAQIQLGKQKMIAQLEASLTIGDKYHFQVKGIGDVIHLKVLGDKLNSDTGVNILNLMRQLGLKATKQNMAFIKLLMNERLPFAKEQLTKAFSFLDSVKNKKVAENVLKEMIASKLPMTDSVFQALYIKNTSGFSEQLVAMLNQLKQESEITPLQQNLMNRLESLIERPMDGQAVLTKRIITEVKQNNSEFFSILKAAGLVDSTVKFSTWKTQWETFANKQNTNIELPFQLNTNTSIKQLEQISQNKISNDNQVLIKQWVKELQKQPIMDVKSFSLLKQQIEQNLLPQLSETQTQTITSLLHNNPTALKQLTAILQTLANQKMYTEIDQLLANIKQNDGLLSEKPKEQFMQQLKQVLKFTGLNHENQIMSDKYSTSIKSMLLNMIMQSDGVTNDRPQQLLHFINGMQLNSVQNTADFIQASLQIPGEKLALKHDVKLDFEGKKTETGEISSDYCRILFYLNLTNLNETIIDMNVQKRSVAITIFNENHDFAEQTTAFKPMLKEGLKKLDYQLSSINFKPLQQTGGSMKPAGESHAMPIQGVDYRI